MSSKISYKLSPSPDESYSFYRSWILGQKPYRAYLPNLTGMKPGEEQQRNIMLELSEITDCLYLSSARAIRAAKLKELGITCIVNATVELPSLPFDRMEYVKISVDDAPYCNLYSYFDAVADKINEVRRKGGKTLVHCVAGISRSASLVLAYLMKYERMTLRRAYYHVKSRRYIIRPNHGFFRQLIDFERRLFGMETVSMVPNAAAGMPIPDVYEHEYQKTLRFQQKYTRQTLVPRMLVCGTSN